MAGEWIKMRTNLWDDPRVSRLCDLVDQPEAMVVGALYWLWSMADEHSEDGLLPGLTLRAIDRKTGVQGIAAALVQVGWLLEVEGGIEVVKFGEHNGTSAKRRCVEAQRKANTRTASAPHADKTPPPCGAREEKIKSSLSPGADAPEQPGDHPEPPPADDTGAPFELTLDWEPAPSTLKAYALRAGLSIGLFTPEAVGAFVVHHAASGRVQTQAQWHAALVNWFCRDKARSASTKVTPLRRPAAADVNFDGKGYLGGGQ